MALNPLRRHCSEWAKTTENSHRSPPSGPGHQARLPMADSVVGVFRFEASLALDASSFCYCPLPCSFLLFLGFPFFSIMQIKRIWVINPRIEVELFTDSDIFLGFEGFFDWCSFVGYIDLGIVLRIWLWFYDFVACSCWFCVVLCSCWFWSRFWCSLEL